MHSSGMSGLCCMARIFYQLYTLNFVIKFYNGFVGHPVIEPPSFLRLDIVDAYANDYMFLSCIKYINKVKTGPFAEHSNQLWGISGVASWSKINGGLIKMYKVEVWLTKMK